MSYKKLNAYFDEICENKNLNKEELFKDFIKDFVNKNKSDLSEKHKFYLKNDEKPQATLIYGDNGDFYELNDGSSISKETFEKIYKPIVVNPNEFFNPLWSREIKLEEKVNPEDFFRNSISDWKIKKYFENIDPSKLKYQDDPPTKKTIITDITNSEETEIEYGTEKDLKKWRSESKLAKRVSNRP